MCACGPVISGVFSAAAHGVQQTHGRRATRQAKRPQTLQVSDGLITTSKTPSINDRNLLPICRIL